MSEWTNQNRDGTGCVVIDMPIPPEDLGTATLSPEGAFEAGSYQSFTLVYTAGKFGIDDSGALRISFRFAADQTPPQFTDPAAPGYTTVEASNNAVLEYRFSPKGNTRPWDKTLEIKVVNGYLSEGDTITVRFGVPDGGPGMRLQTFCEDSFEFKVLVDPIATYTFQPLPEQPAIKLVPGAPERFVATLPTLCRTGSPFALKIKGEDRWGNPSDRCDTRFTLRPSMPVVGLPEQVTLAPGAFAAVLDDLRVSDPGDLTIDLVDAEGHVAATSNPLRIVEDTPLLHFWGDLHGQSEETIGTGSAREYFAFARDRAFVDVTGHQGNDFQITNQFYAQLDRLCAEFNEDGSFVAIPGYEWSGNTSMGGDRNVFFPTEGRQIRRSSHALIPDGSDAGMDVHTTAELFDTLAMAGEWDVVMYAHCGGRYADIRKAHDGRFEKSVEVHSSWGTFEWLLHDAIEMGYRVGVVCNSDGHKGRPGASYPGSSMFGAIGGLTCFLAEDLTREGILDAMRKRHHYGTTGGPGGRMVIDVRADFDAEGTLYHDDPALGSAEGRPARSAMMGDIVHLPSGGMTLNVDVRAAAPIERLDIFSGKELIETIRPYGPEDLGNRIRVIWQGAEYRGRFRQVIWDGSARLIGNRIERARPINFFNRDKTLEQRGDSELAWRALTTGNLGGFDMWISDSEAGRLAIETPLVSCDLALADIGYEDTVFDRSAALERKLRVFRLSADNPHRTMTLARAIRLKETGDNIIHIRLTQEDGTQAWTSPIYVFR
jgi:hypothetical protein